ncbi:hypothetical protein HMPREF3202_02349 [Prevotella bivia]|uniref:Uncharacterized protein n=1 Tax=Prevotella bivia TaxID=28125 RepID=A0A137SQ96_9BACT|nr:hypothetical protein HMPREF3202_02349 [Prevotella bivia]
MYLFLNLLLNVNEALNIRKILILKSLSIFSATKGHVLQGKR